MTRWVMFTVVLGLVAGLPAQAQLPQTLDEMKAQHVLLGAQPEGAVKNFIDACFVYANPETRQVGREMLQYLAIPLKSEANWDRLPGNRLFAERLTDQSYAHVWRSYAVGATPENGYLMDPDNWELNVERTYRHDDDERGLQVYLRSGGADAPRVVYVKQSTTTGLWYVNIWHTLFVDIRPPVAAQQAWEPVTDVAVPEGLPKTLNELRALHQQIGAEPQGAVKCFLNACFAYMDPQTRDEGRKMLQYMAIPLSGEASWDTLPSNRLFAERLTGASHAHIWRSYAVGATPENAYQMNVDNWQLNFERTNQLDNDPRGLQVYLRSGGADAPRVVYVLQNEQSGLWHVNIWNSLFAGIRAPVDPNVEQFQ
ncbi:MAG: DUF6935 domain-containing protein [Armatimonadota bacterium]|jgi:hypothetical protein